MLEDVLKTWGANEATPIDLYTDIFRLGDGELQRENEAPGEFKTNPIALCKGKNGKMFRRIMFEDTFEESLEILKDTEFAYLNGCTYFGRTNSIANASKMYAMIFDLDGVDDKRLNNFLSGAYNGGAYPVPNYIVLSGTGIHLYYIFEYPIPLYPNIKLQLKEFKYALTERIWNPLTSYVKKVQHQGINQAFRIPGTPTKKNQTTRPYATAYKLHDHLYCFDQLNEFVPDENKVDESKLYKASKMTLAEAKKKYPEWYHKRIELGEPKGTYTCNRALYDWWLKKIKEGAAYHHRYFCIMCLCIYAAKCGIDELELMFDIYNLMPFLNALNPDEPFTQEDVNCAMECYDDSYRTFPRKEIAKLSGIEIKENKRNHQKREWHLEDIRDRKRKMKSRGQEFKAPEGRPKGSGTKEAIIKTYRKIHPEATKADCIRATGFSKPTVYKWWD